MQTALQNKLVVIFGGSAGIGLATARCAAAEGADIMIISRDAGKLRAAAAVLPRSKYFVADIRDGTAVSQALAQCEIVDHVFISVGEGGTSDVLMSSMEDLRRPFEERVFGVLNVVRGAAPKMKDGSITLMSGMNASRVRPGAAAQTAALAAVETLVPALALDLAPIRINAVAPGWIDTLRLDRIFGGDKPDRLKAIADKLPGSRIGDPDEVAKVVLMLMTVAYINGEVVHVDGLGRFVAS